MPLSHKRKSSLLLPPWKQANLQVPMAPPLTITKPFSSVSIPPNQSTKFTDFTFSFLSRLPENPYNWYFQRGKPLLPCNLLSHLSNKKIGIKLLIKILATCLFPHVSGLIDLDQVDFLPGKEDLDNMIKVLNLINVASSAKTSYLF